MVEGGVVRSRSTSVKRKNVSGSAPLATRDRSDSQKKVKLTDEYSQNRNTLISLGISLEKQALMEKGLRDDDVLRKQRAVINEMSRKRDLQKPGATAR